MNYLKNSIFKCFFWSIIDFFKIFFLQHIMAEHLILEEENIKDKSNIFRLKKEQSTLQLNTYIFFVWLKIEYYVDILRIFWTWKRRSKLF